MAEPSSPQQEAPGNLQQDAAPGSPQAPADSDDLGPFQGQDDRQAEESEARIKDLDAQNQKWKEFMGGGTDFTVKSLTMAVPIRARRAKEAIKGLAQIVARLRAMHIPITRIHTDRAQEFCGKEFQQWLENRDLWHTTTAGDEPSANARAENHLKLLKGRTRTLMKTAQCELTYWPLALRYASEERFRSQLRECGVPAPPMLPFGIRGYAKKKAWQDKHAMWRAPMMGVRVWGPACDMSMTSKGYFLQVEGTNQFMRSTVIIIPKQSPTVLDPVNGGAPGAPHPQQQAGVVEPPQANAGVDEALLYSPSLGPDDIDHPGDLLDDNPNPGELELALEEPPAGDRGIPPHDPPRRRVNGKKGPQFYDGRPFEPTLRHLKVGGEWEEEEEWRQWYKQWRRCNKAKDLAVMEHDGLVTWIKEERQTARDPQTLQVMLEAEQKLNQLEATLEREAKISKVSLEQEAEEEVLQTRVIPLEEVKRDMASWKPVFQKEYDALVAGPVTPIFEKEWREMERQEVPVEVLPAKAIASKKPPNRKKGRVVVCGNFTEDRDGQDVSVGGVCAMAVRGMVHVATCKQWAIGSIDVTGAFLQAPRRQKATTSIVQPPRLLHQLGITKTDERWRVNCALYGFVESPADWAACRDAELEKMTWEEGDWFYWLERSPEQHLWKVKKAKKMRKEGEQGGTAGWIAVYVDDFLVTMPTTEIAAAFRRIKETWKCSEEEYVVQEHAMRFCGYELRKREDGGMELTQEGYITDILQKYGVSGTENTPVPKFEDAEDEQEPPIAIIKEAQALCGELLWIAGRTRPDVAYGVGLMSRLIHRRPTLVVQIGHHMLRYLHGSSHLGLVYKPVKETEEEWKRLKVLADTSFAPPHEKYRSVQAVVVEHGTNILAWQSARQAFITHSTAEAELVGYSEAFQIGEATSALLQVLEICASKSLIGDSKAALAQLLGDTGPWRTRHLRLRSAKLREALRGPGAEWAAEHCPGGELVADGLTKRLDGSAFQKFVNMLRMKPERKNHVSQQEPRVAKLEGFPSHQVLINACLVAAVALIQTDVVTAGLLLLVGYVLREVVGRTTKDTEKDRKIPKRTSGGKRDTMYGSDWSGTVTPNAGTGIPHLGNDPRDQLGVGGFQPRICALRPDGQSHGRRGGIADRGRAAMPLLNQRRQAAAELSVPSPASNHSEELEIGHELQSVQELQSMLASLELQPEPERENPSGSGSAEQPSNESHEQRQVEAAEPWLLPQFRTIQRSSKDQWNFTLWDQGWAIREHRKHRVRAFHPVHSSTPFDCAILDSERVTRKVCPREEIVTDQWTAANTWRGEAWMGYTFFRLSAECEGFEVIRP
jgi:hypothetical protein